MAKTSDQGIRIPDPADSNMQLPDALSEAAEDFAAIAVQRYATVTERTSKNPDPAPGQIGFMEDTGRFMGFKDGIWSGLMPFGLCAVIYSDKAQSLPAAGNTTIIHNKIERDTSGGTMVNLKTQPTRVTITVPGLYILTGQVVFAASASGIVRHVAFRISGNTSLLTVRNNLSTSAIKLQQCAGTVASLDAGDYVELIGYCGGRSTTAPTSGTCKCRLAVAQIG